MSFRVNPTRGLKADEIVDAAHSAELNKKLKYADEPIKVGQRTINIFSFVNYIKIRHQVQYGEFLSIRGEGFSVMKNGNFVQADWNNGVALDNAGKDSWNALINAHTTKVAFKILINDKIWEEGENHDFEDMVFLTWKA
jgi:hypothetical protein